MAEFFHKVEVSDYIECAARDQVLKYGEIIGIHLVDIPTFEAVDVIGIVESPSIDEMARADKIVDAPVSEITSVEAGMEGEIDLHGRSHRDRGAVT